MFLICSSIVVTIMIVAPGITGLDRFALIAGGGAVFCVLIAYLFSRTRNYEIGCWILFASNLGEVAIALQFTPTPEVARTAAVIFLISILFSGLILTPRATLVAISLILAEYGLILLLGPEANRGAIIFSLLLFMTASSLVVIGARVRERAEREKDETLGLLRNSERRLQEAHELAQMGAWEVDVETNRGLWTEGMFRIYGLPLTDDVPINLLMANVHPDDRAGLAASIRHLLETWEPLEHEFRIDHPQRGLRYLFTQAKGISGPKGRRVRIVGTLQDITDQRIDQQTIEMQRAKMVTAARLSALGEMSGGIAHEINNPLAIIHGRASQLRQMFESGTADLPTVKVLSEKIEATAMRISQIVRSLRSFSRDAEKDPLIDASLEQIVEETSDLCKERFKGHQIEFIVDPIPPGLRIHCRPVQVSQVILNLVLNSHDAVEEMPTKRIEVSARLLPEFVEISVRDSGPGIPVELQEKIFQPFFTTKEFGRGTGLGLSISRGIVQDHGGTLRLEEADRSTCFVVSFPRSKKER